MSERIYCSEQNPHEPMMGTADPVDVWLLLEYRPAWKAKAVEQSSLGEPARAWLNDAIDALGRQGLKARPQLIRRPEIDSDEVQLMVAVPDALVRFSGRGYGFLSGVDALAVATDPGAFETLAEPRYFVCTNGQRDACCARFGLPVYAGLRERVGRRAWQITHLGGHRFAPNVLALPQGVVYGRVVPESLDQFVEAVEGGRLAVPHVRGRSWYAPPVQAAEALCGDAQVRFLHAHSDGDCTAVTFRTPTGERRVRVCRAEPMAVLKSCGDDAEKPVTPFREA